MALLRAELETGSLSSSSTDGVMTAAFSFTYILHSCSAESSRQNMYVCMYDTYIRLPDVCGSCQLRNRCDLHCAIVLHIERMLFVCEPLFDLFRKRSIGLIFESNFDLICPLSELSDRMRVSIWFFSFFFFGSPLCFYLVGQANGFVYALGG